MEAAKAAALSVVESLAPEDLLAVVGFGDKSELLLAPEKAGTKAKAREAIDRLTPAGNTPLYAAVQTAVQTLQPLQGVIPRAVVLTDGYPTDVKDAAQYRALADWSFRNGVPIATVGFGQYNDTILRALADVGGWWQHARGLQDLGRAFSEELGRARATVLRRPVLWLRFLPGAVLLEAHMARPVPRPLAAQGTGPNAPLPIPDLVLRESQEYLLRVRLPPAERPGVLELGQIALGTHTGEVLRRGEIHVDVTRDAELSGHTVARPTAVYNLTVALEKGTMALERGDRALARQAREEARTILKNPRLREALNPEEAGKTRAVLQSSGAVADGGPVDAREAVAKMRRGESG